MTKEQLSKIHKYLKAYYLTNREVLEEPEVTDCLMAIKAVEQETEDIKTLELCGNLVDTFLLAVEDLLAVVNRRVQALEAISGLSPEESSDSKAT